jgi:hypothetical protein
MSKYLTLAISETFRNSNKFKIIIYDINTEAFSEEEKSEKDFFDRSGVPNWDLFHVTEVKNNKEKIIDRYSKKQIINLFKQNQISLEKFLQSTSMVYGIVKLNNFKELQPIDDKFQTRVVVRSKGTNKQLLNKDYRWVKYWNSLNKDSYEEKIIQWKNFLNNSNNEVYAVMYRHTFRNGSKSQWIAGFHCIKED